MAKKLKLEPFQARFLVNNTEKIRNWLTELGKSEIIWKGRPVATKRFPIDGINYFYNYIWLSAPYTGDDNEDFIENENMVCVRILDELPNDIEVAVVLHKDRIELVVPDLERNGYKCYSTWFKNDPVPSTMDIPTLTSSRNGYGKLGYFHPMRLKLPTIPRDNRIPDFIKEMFWFMSVSWPEDSKERKDGGELLGHLLSNLSKYELKNIKTGDFIELSLEPKNIPVKPAVKGNKFMADIDSKTVYALVYDVENNKFLTSKDIESIIYPEQYNLTQTRILQRQVASKEKRLKKAREKQRRKAENERKYQERLKNANNSIH